MGGNHSLMDVQFNLRLQSKEAQKMHYKCLREEEEERLKVKSAIEANEPDSARLHASNSIRKRNEAMRFLEFKTRLDILTSQVDFAIRNSKVTAELKKAMPQLNDLLKSNKLDSLDSLKQFQKVFEDLNVRNSSLNQGVESDLSYLAPAQEVDLLITKVADEYALDVGDMLRAPTEHKSPTPAHKKEANRT